MHVLRRGLCFQGLASGARDEPPLVPQLSAGFRHLHVRASVPVSARPFQDIVGPLRTLGLQPSGLQCYVSWSHVNQVI
jgi:hypothetical protein